ncbi:type II toxin-antitoxin system prevent-host-death family antitoxin [Streptomyces sp. NPDC008139]|uniref:type II toxin-antitoxin system Phd/YefM family antitoxin n=1 Tax=Streptomyces sp. NPDC008139 TaxID=3364814 RepID=UPI0036EFE0A4
MTDIVTVREARANLAEAIDKAVAGEATVITRNGQPAAALIPIADYDALEDAADELLAREAAEHLDEPTVSMSEVLADLFQEGTPAA